MSTYVPTGGQFNDPDRWKTDPSYGQIGANRGAGYNPAYWADKGGEDAFHASRRTYRARAQEGGDIYNRRQNAYATIAAARPRNQGELGQLLNSQGIYNQKEQHQALYRTITGDYNNNINGNYQYDTANGRKMNVGTSDVRASWEPMTADDYAFQNRGFYGRIDDEFGGNRFLGWAQHGKSGLRQSPQGFWYNPGANGQYVGGTVYDNAGWAIDPRTGRRVGGGYMPGMGSYRGYGTLGSMMGRNRRY